MERGIGFLEQLLFGGGGKKEGEEDDDGSSSFSSSSSPSSPDDPKCIISRLSPLANSVIARCSKILHVPTQVLLQRFETNFNQTNSANTHLLLLEYCSYQALHVLTQRPDYLSHKDFRRLTYDMMLAWEQLSTNVTSEDSTFPKNQGVEDDEGWSLFYTNSISMAVQVDDEKTVGPEAFARIAPACAAIADIITVQNLFDVLTSSSDGQLHFLIYDKYLESLDKVIQTAICTSVRPLCSNLKLAEGEIILNVDGTGPTQPVLQHIGISTWPGRLTLTNHAIYFEAGVGLYDKAVRYDLTMESKQVVKPELTGPLGSRLFDDAVMYKSTSVDEPVYLEFPEFKGHSRRDYWLENILEILHAHKFIKKYNFKEIQQMEVLSKTILGIFRLRAVREAFHIFPSHYKTLLGFNLAEKLPRGDMILETLSNRIQLLSQNSKHDAVGIAPADEKQMPSPSPVSLLTLTKLGFVLARGPDADKETEILVGDVCIGEISPLETAVKQSKCDTGRAERAQATVDQVKVEGIDANIAVMKELLFPVLESIQQVCFLTSWEDPFKSTVFLVIICHTIYRNWIKYAVPCILVFLAALILWCKHRYEGKPLGAFRVTPPPSKNAVEQLLALQEAISRFETFLQAGNIILLKLRALLFSVLPQATDEFVMVLVGMAIVFVFMPLKMIVILILLETYTRKMPLRKDCNDRWLRRVREWWVRIPAAPVLLIKQERK